MTAPEELLTREEMREALDDPTSPYYLEAIDRTTVLRAQVTLDRPLEVAFALAHRLQHEDRELGGRTLAARTARGERRRVL